MQGRLGGIWVLSILLMTGCASSRPVATGRSVDYNSYSEDLSSVRPVYTVGSTSQTTNKPTSVSSTNTPTPTAPRRTDTRKLNTLVEATHINRRLDLVLDTIAIQNRTIRYAAGFRIQVYVGNQRQEADAAKLLIYQNFPELNPYLTYNQPTYKLKVGDFMRRIDAERYYTSIRKLIGASQLQSDKVDIRRSLLIK